MINRVNVLSNIKNEIVQSGAKTYQNCQLKKIENYYSLYLNKIVFIQRTYRKCLTRKTKNLQKSCMHMLQSLKQNKQINSRLKGRLQELKRQHNNLQNYDQQVAIQKYQIWLQQKLRNALKNVLNSGDIFSKNNAMIKCQILTFEQIKTQNQQLEEQHQAIEHQYILHQQKLNKWKTKLKDLRNSICYEKIQIDKIQGKIKRKAEQSTTF